MPTYQRNRLLVRALESLRNQTLPFWVCELHNDDPEDRFPHTLATELNDPRIVVHQHQTKLGGVGTFNLFYLPCREPFVAILEDDNKWEPDFLEKMVDALELHPNATLAWSNQTIWEEDATGEVSFTGKCVRPVDVDHTPLLIPWGHPAQALGALHANGAMLLRADATYTTPEIPFGGIEGFRERMIPHPILYVPEPLASFTVTRTTARSGDQNEWNALLVALLITYVDSLELSPEQLAVIWKHYQSSKPSPSSAFIIAALLEKSCRPLLSSFKTTDWWNFLKTLRHPKHLWNALMVRHRHRDWFTELNTHTLARAAELKRTPKSENP